MAQSTPPVLAMGQRANAGSEVWSARKGDALATEQSEVCGGAVTHLVKIIVNIDILESKPLDASEYALSPHFQLRHSSDFIG